MGGGECTDWLYREESKSKSLARPPTLSEEEYEEIAVAEKWKNVYA